VSPHIAKCECESSYFGETNTNLIYTSKKDEWLCYNPEGSTCSQSSRVPRRDYERKKIEDMTSIREGRICFFSNQLKHQLNDRGVISTDSRFSTASFEKPRLNGRKARSRILRTFSVHKLRRGSHKPNLALAKVPRIRSGAARPLGAFDQISLSDHCKSIICGTLLGDGCLQITKGYKNARLSIRHSQVQREYFDWKVANLQEISSAKSVQISKSSGFGKNPKFLFQSSSLPDLTSLYNLTYKKKRLCIRRRWLNKLTPLSLAIWWCDDGSIIGNPPRRGVLCTDGFDEKSVRLLARYFEKVWKIHAHVGAIRRNRIYGNSTKTEYYRLWFSTEELKKFLRIIMPHIPVASMVYKTILIYKDSQFQQRWISEQSTALPHFVEEIKKIYSLKSRRAVLRE
jgi:LAGLIDADG DNA endonuclease family